MIRIVRTSAGQSSYEEGSFLNASMIHIDGSFNDNNTG